MQKYRSIREESQLSKGVIILCIIVTTIAVFLYDGIVVYNIVVKNKTKRYNVMKNKFNNPFTRQCLCIFINTTKYPS